MKKIIFSIFAIVLTISLYAQTDKADFIDFKIEKIDKLSEYDYDSEFSYSGSNMHFSGFTSDNYAVVYMYQDFELILKAYFSDEKLISLTQDLENIKINMYFENDKYFYSRRIYKEDNSSGENTLSSKEIEQINELSKLYIGTYEYFLLQKYMPDNLFD
ncbi:MAG: hypothetical protein JXR68_14235 [Bacteroidales bacterium]|nr:hypothetical protein [Bacteroidales bacterium]